ncbi:MAG TPA: NTP transferase domain-containing protein [Rhizomicrobium sp.]|jgi:xanthine dehydrogenase accessory factor|nr:NTP transferase domain-containing protein [Rhizomicrobium sp.]
MRRDTLEKLTAPRQPLVRALDLLSGEEKLIDPAKDDSPLGKAAAKALALDASGPVPVNGREWFLTVYNLPWELVIVGAVHIAQALAALAIASGYRLRIIDPRPAYARAERFTGIALEHEWPDEALTDRPLSARSALIALAHDPKIDDPALAAALRSPAFYVGALGSARTHARRLQRLAASGFSQKELARIHGPVGLAIGARTPGEIALSILSDLVRVRRAPRAAGHIGGVVLAAGLSSRMGSNKMITPLKGKPLVRHAVEAALTAGLDPVIIVTGHEASSVEKALTGLDVSFIHNDQYADGLSGSLRRGVAALPEDCDGALVLLGDMPAIGAGLIARTIAAFDPASRAICVATARGQYGHPVLWGRQFFPEIAMLTGDSGARALLNRHAAQVCEIEAGDDAPLTDIDTRADLDAYSSSKAAK